jgi:hypothetical protein
MIYKINDCVALTTCACGDAILADTEEWQQPRCFNHATDDGKTDSWRCKYCGCRPYSCLCKEPDWTKGNIDLKRNRKQDDL